VLRGGEQGDIRKLQTRRGGLRRLRTLVRHVSAFIVISREIDNELAAVGVPAERRVFIPNGVDTARFAPALPVARSEARRIFALGDGPVAVFTGRLAPEKRLDLIIGAWPAVRAAHPDAELLIAGDGPEMARLSRLTGPGVRFVGALDDVLPVLQAADVFVLPSDTEGLSNALLEAMAAGLAPLATAVGGAPDLITPGKNGLLVPAGDRAALTTALLELLAEPERRVRMGEAARARVIADYSLQRTAAGLRALYDRVLTESHRSPAYAHV
jgi:glycosyltransferase involved in cell wall biosynthesis